MGHRVSLFVISLYLCTQLVFTEVEMNVRAHFSPTRKEMILMIDTKQSSPFPGFGILSGQWSYNV